MRRLSYPLLLLIGGMLFIAACSQDDEVAPVDEVPQEILTRLQTLGFDIDDQAPIVFERGYLVEGDIYLTEEDIDRLSPSDALRIPTEEQYHTTNLVSSGGARTITIFISSDGGDFAGLPNANKYNPGAAKPSGTPGGGNNGGGGDGGDADYSVTYGEALTEAINRFNAENLELQFAPATSKESADIIFTRLNKRDERRGVLGSAGFPTASGDPYGEVKMSGVLESSYGLSVNGIATIMAHELGHCIGFRHTDYFDRSVSCGGSTSNEGQAGVGAIHVPGTPTGATLAAKSWMLACTDGGDRPFNNDDKTALTYLY
jgi:hypothetical protein